MSRAVRIWLWTCCALVAGMVVVGGITRLTGSGLSIVEWAPLSGAIPPLSHEGWLDALGRYRATPEGRLVHPGIALGEFQVLFLIEWAHRLLARVLALSLVVPFVLLRRSIDDTLRRRLLIVAGLAALQAAVGWWMVKSGLFDAPHVSPYRLITHLLIGFAIFGTLLFATLDDAAPEPVPLSIAAGARGLLFAVALTAATGGAMAGTRAGLLFATFPDMNGAFVPAGVFAGGARAAFEDPLTAHFNHRLLAAALSLTILAFARATWSTALRPRVVLLLCALGTQIALGVATVALHVPIAIAALHQLGGLFVFGASVSLVQACRVPDRAVTGVTSWS